jgi:hypothetical protein
MISLAGGCRLFLERSGAAHRSLSLEQMESCLRRGLSSVPALWLGSGKRMGHQDFYSDSME